MMAMMMKMIKNRHRFKLVKIKKIYLNLNKCLNEENIHPNHFNYQKIKRVSEF